MDNSQSAFEIVGERIKERAENRLQIAEERRARRNHNSSKFESIDFFYRQFANMKEELEKKLQQSEQLSKLDPKSFLNEISCDIQMLQQFLNESSMFLPAFQIKKSQEHIDTLEAELQKITNLLQPKKKFGFRNKTANKTQVSSSTVKPDSHKVPPVINIKSSTIIQSSYFGFKDVENETLRKLPEEIKGRQLNLQNLENCKIIALGNPGSLQFANLRKCTIIIGPTTRSAFIKECSECTFVIACQQVRIHDTSNTNFYLHVTGAVIIEHCEDVRFAPYNLQYDGLDQHYKQSGLSLDVNNWEKVEDFNWLNENEKSPNLSFITTSQLINEWL